RLFPAHAAGPRDRRPHRRRARCAAADAQGNGARRAQPRVVGHAPRAAAARRGRQAALLDLYALMKTLGAARLAASSGVAHAEVINRAASGDRQDPAEKFRALRAQLGTLINAANTLSR